MKKTLATLGILITSLLLSQAHEFWLQADKFFLEPGDKLHVKFMVGENFMGEAWDLQKHVVERLDLYEGGNKRSVVDSIDAEKGLLSLQLKYPGLNLLVMESNAAYIELAGDKFNEYLKEDGLDDVYEQREKTKSLQRPARELYSRHSKLFLQVGAQAGDIFNRVIGLPIELVPDKNPTTLRKGDTVKFSVLFEGKPLFGAKVRLWNRFDNRTTIQNIYTEKDGTIEMRVSNPGPWMVSVVKMVPSRDKKADWQSYWGSLVFGIK